ncbi:hypothetical protein [Rhodoferax sp.]|uniref:hypothetical protein n=1 Tax=Rhodoferax sp. TaxID=50421 RepID=UPI002611912D|nr:hypothetical protein [Rhodoferax sp.]MDD2925090.1 hypothetical protein [Rhodoferax sp.]
MKTATTLKFVTLAALLGAALSVTVLAQPGPGPGPGAGGPMMQGASQAGPAARGMRNMRFDKNNTPGWSLMTAEERRAFQTKMHAVKTYEECKLLQTEHHTAMEARAKEKGVTLPTPRQNGCDNMKARGFIK